MAQKMVVITVVVAFLAAGFGFALGRNLIPVFPEAQNAINNAPSGAQPKDPINNLIFSKQSAVIEGEIVEKKGSTIVVMNKNGLGSEFQISQNLLVYKPTANSQVASASGDLDLVNIGDDVIFNLEVVGPKYQVTSISYPTQAPPVRR